MTPTQRSLKLLRARGGIVAVTEKWNPHVGIRQDLFGFADLIHVHGDDVTLVQTTSGDNVAARLEKIRTNENALIWLGSAHRHIVVHGWRKVGPRGKRKLWDVREVVVGGSEVKL